MKWLSGKECHWSMNLLGIAMWSNIAFNTWHTGGVWLFLGGVGVQLNINWLIEKLAYPNGRRQTPDQHGYTR